MAVMFTDIMNTLYLIIKSLVSLIIYVIKTIIVFFFRTLMRILSYIAFLLPFSPFAIVIICVFIIMAILWDEVTVPIIYAIIEVINGIIGGWNKIADGVRNIGFRMPGLGYIRLGGIPLPRGDEIGADIPNFWDFIWSIIKPLVLVPIEEALKGVIIR